MNFVGHFWKLKCEKNLLWLLVGRWIILQDAVKLWWLFIHNAIKDGFWFVFQTNRSNKRNYQLVSQLKTVIGIIPRISRQTKKIIVTSQKLSIKFCYRHCNRWLHEYFFKLMMMSSQRKWNWWRWKRSSWCWRRDWDWNRWRLCLPEQYHLK